MDDRNDNYVTKETLEQMRVELQRMKAIRRCWCFRHQFSCCFSSLH